MEISLNRSQQSPIEQSGASSAPANDPTAALEEKVSGEFDPRKNLNPDAQTKIHSRELEFLLWRQAGAVRCLRCQYESTR